MRRRHRVRRRVLRRDDLPVGDRARRADRRLPCRVGPVVAAGRGAGHLHRLRRRTTRHDRSGCLRRARAHLRARRNRRADRGTPTLPDSTSTARSTLQHSDRPVHWKRIGLRYTFVRHHVHPPSAVSRDRHGDRPAPRVRNRVHDRARVRAPGLAARRTPSAERRRGRGWIGRPAGGLAVVPRRGRTRRLGLLLHSWWRCTGCRCSSCNVRRASSVGVTALVGRRVLGTVLGRRRSRAAGGLGVGLVLLASGAKAEEATAVSTSAQWWLGYRGRAGGCGCRRDAVLLKGGAAGRRHAGRDLGCRLSPAPGSRRGCCRTRIRCGACSTAPASYALAIFGVAGMAFFAAAFQRTAGDHRDGRACSASKRSRLRPSGCSRSATRRGTASSSRLLWVSSSRWPARCCWRSTNDP